VGSELGSSLQTEGALPRVLRLIVPAFADWGTIHLVEDQRIRLVAVADVDPQVERLTQELEERFPHRPGSSTWLAAAIEEGRPRLFAADDDALLAAVRQPEQLQALHRMFRQAVVVPVTARGRTFGALSLGVRTAGRSYDRADLSLAQNLAERIANAIDNSRLYREAEDANRMKDQFLATLSHELRTPLNAIVGWVQILRESGLDPQLRSRALDTIQRNARIQTQLIEDMLDVSRIVSGKLQIQVQRVDLGRVIEAALDAVKPAADAKRIELDQDLEAGVVLGGDADRLQQVMWNLLSNAIKFTPNGGRVGVRLRRKGQEGAIEVRDSGIGIPPEFIGRIFERFSQADASSARPHRGLGLGLAIVRHLVELHGGTVAAESAGESRGSTFAVHLPLRPVPHDAASDGLREPAGADGLRPGAELDGLAILVVDDDAEARELMAILLRRMGAGVTVAASAAEALEALERTRPDVLLSDIEMPHEDGYSLMRRIRELPEERGGRIPAAALTAYARAEDRLRALAAGYQAHLPKPIRPADLADVVRTLVARQPNPDSV
jgi:signal transduction histidine kinase/ActR/RegA family two-component response regulator